MQNQRGFSLIELLIVVTLIGLIAALAVPNTWHLDRAANEGSAVSALRTLHGANAGYAATVGSGNYAGTAGTAGPSPLSDLLAARLIDNALGSGMKSGFSFIGDRTVASSSGPATFYFSANPSIPSGILMTGTKRFGVAHDGVIRVDTAQGSLGTPFDAVTLPAAQPLSYP